MAAGRADSAAWSICVRGGCGVVVVVVVGLKWVLGTKQGGERESLSSKQLFQHHTVAFPCRWLIQVRRAGRGEIRLWALSVNHTALPHRRHLSPNTKGFSPGGTLKPISALTRNPSRSTKSSIVERHHIHFLCKRGDVGERGTGGWVGVGGGGRGGSKKAENSEEKRDLKGLWDVSLGTAGGCFCLYLFPMSQTFIQLWLGRYTALQ